MAISKYTDEVMVVPPAAIAGLVLVTPLVQDKRQSVRIITRYRQIEGDGINIQECENNMLLSWLRLL